MGPNGPGLFKHSFHNFSYLRQRELTDPLTSMRCLAAVLTCMFCAETKHVHLSALERRSGVVFRFAATERKFCRAVQADFLLVFLCGFPDPICDTCNIVGVFEGLLTRQLQLLFFCQAMVWNPSLVRGSRCSRKVNGTLAKGAQLWTEHLRGACSAESAVRVCEPTDILLRQSE